MHLLRFVLTRPSLAELGGAEARPRSRVLTPGRRPRSQPSIHTLACLCDINHDLHPLLPWSPIDLLYPKVPFKSHSTPHPPQTPAASSLSPYRKRLGSASSSTRKRLSEAFPIKASDHTANLLSVR